MNIAEGFAAEFQVEAAATRTFLERFEDEHADWQPHDKSMTLSRLATHVVECPGWVFSILDGDHFDFGTTDYQSPHWKTRDELLANHERIGAGFLERLEGRDDEFMRAPWRLLNNGHVLQETVRDRRGARVHPEPPDPPPRPAQRVLPAARDRVPGPYGPSADDHNG